MWLKKKYFASSKLRAEFFPVEWRSSLALDGGRWLDSLLKKSSKQIDHGENIYYLIGVM
jgi:hypothetical protein